MRYENEYWVYDDETNLLRVKDGIEEFYEQFQRRDLYNDRDEEMEFSDEINYSLILPDSMKILHRGAFSGMHFSSIELPDSIQLIEHSVFSNCDWLTRIVWPSTVKCIKKETFFSCDALEEVSLPEGLLTIGEEAFKFCHSLEKIVIPSTVVEFGRHVFSYCTSLKSIHVPRLLYDKYDQNDYYFVYGTLATVTPYDEPVKKSTVTNTKSEKVTASTIEAVSATTKKFKSFSGVIRKNLIAEKKNKS